MSFFAQVTSDDQVVPQVEAKSLESKQPPAPVEIVPDEHTEQQAKSSAEEDEVEDEKKHITRYYFVFIL